MGLKNDQWIIAQAKKGMIHPFHAVSVRTVDTGWASQSKDKVISYGVSSYGYDMRLAGEFQIYTNRWPGIIDPKDFDANVTFHPESVYEPAEGCAAPIIIPPNSFALARSMEYFHIPRGVMCICLGKSTYARCGLIVNVTAFEPEWEGNVTIELSNTTPLPIRVYPFEGIAQVLFLEADEVCETSYADRHGKYQGQLGITLAKV